MANEITVRVKAEDSATATFQKVGKEAQGLGKVFTDVGKIAGGFLAANVIAGAGQKITSFIGQSITAASDLGESLNAVNKIFGESAKVILDWGDKQANAYGLSQRAFNQLAVPLGAGLRNAGLESDVVAQKTIELTKRAADMASVFNTDVSEALAAIQAGLRGEADPLERFGVGLSAAKVEAHALAMTGKDVASSLTEQEKMLARVDLLMQQTASTQGDFAQTSGEVANAARIQAAKMEELQATIGQKLLPVQLAITKAKLAMVDAIATQVVPALDNFIKYIQFAYTEGDQFNDFLGNLPPSLRGVALGFGELAVYLSQGEEGFKNNKIAVSDLGQQLIALAQIAQASSAAVQENWDKIAAATEIAFTLVGAQLDLFMSKTREAVQAVSGMVSFVDNILHTEWAAAWNDMKDIAGLAIDGVIAYIDGLFAGLPGMLYKRGSDAGRSFLNGLKDAAGSLVPDINLPNLNPMDFRADGGPVSGGKPYIVGERGPELFVPSQSGGIVPNGQLGGSVNVTMHVENLYGDQASGKRVGNDIGWALMLRGAI